MQKIGICPVDLCPMCEKHKETNAHLIGECEHDIQKVTRDALRHTIGEIICQTCSPEKREPIRTMFAIKLKTKITESYLNITDDYAPIQDWKIAWNTPNAERTSLQQAHARMMETLMNTQNPYPLHTGVIYKSDLWIMEWAGVPDSKILQTFRKIREELMQTAKQLWKNRQEIGPEWRHEPTDQNANPATHINHPLPGNLQTTHND
jgi:hypothetical protein